jgi:cGMP-dependent protein kinase 2
MSSKKARDEYKSDSKDRRRVYTPESHDNDNWGKPVLLKPKAKSGPVAPVSATAKQRQVVGSGPLPRAPSAKTSPGSFTPGTPPGKSSNFGIDRSPPNIIIPLPTQPKPVFVPKPKAPDPKRSSKSGILYQDTPYSKSVEGGAPPVVIESGLGDQGPPSGSKVVKVPDGDYELNFAVLSQRGHYPDQLRKANQDSYSIHTSFGGDPNDHFFGVFDGHGEYGQHCSDFARKNLWQNLINDPHYPDDVVRAFHSAYLNTNAQLHKHSQYDDSMSGTTGITILVRGKKMYVANVGDSRAVLGIRRQKKVVAKDLSFDQTPYRSDECERVKGCGARVMTLDQMEGLKPANVECWNDENHDDGDPPRLWVADDMYPGTAFTRSIGDSVAEQIGVTAVPEVLCLELRPRHPFFMIASDGVFEFLSSQTVIDMVALYQDPKEACLAVVKEAHRLWLKYETRTDDITIIVVHVDGLRDPNKHKKAPTETEDEVEQSRISSRPVRTMSRARERITPEESAKQRAY